MLKVSDILEGVSSEDRLEVLGQAIEEEIVRINVEDEVDDLEQIFSKIVINLEGVKDIKVIEFINREYEHIKTVNILEDKTIIEVSNILQVIMGDYGYETIMGVLDSIEETSQDMSEIVLDFANVNIHEIEVIYKLAQKYPEVTLMNIPEELDNDKERLKVYNERKKYKSIDSLANEYKNKLELNRPYACIRASEKVVVIPKSVTDRNIICEKYAIKKKGRNYDISITSYSITTVSLYIGDAVIFDMEEEELEEFFKICATKDIEFEEVTTQAEKDKIVVENVDDFCTETYKDGYNLGKLVDGTLKEGKKCIMDFTECEFVSCEFMIGMIQALKENKSIEYKGMSNQLKDTFNTAKTVIMQTIKIKKYEEKYGKL